MAYDLYEEDGETGDKWVWQMLASVFIVEYVRDTKERKKTWLRKIPGGRSARKEGQPTKPESLNRALLGGVAVTLGELSKRGTTRSLLLLITSWTRLMR